MKRLLLILCIGLFLVSCTSRRVKPNRQSRRAIDTIYKENVVLIQPEIDSLCIILYDSIYAVAVDSILKERQEEMNALIK
jgi:hypothetical protein